MSLNLSGGAEEKPTMEDIDIKKLPRISKSCFLSAKKIMGVLPGNEWTKAMEDSWDIDKTDFVGWAPSADIYPREHKDIVVLFRRKRDGAEYWYHSDSATLVFIQKYL